MVPRIHLITDFPCYDDSVLDLLELVVEQGVDAVQVRAKGLGDRALYGFTRRLVERLAGTTARVIVNDRLGVALAARADGVHLGGGDLPVGEARRIVPTGFLVGATCRDAEQARLAAVEGADYAGVGPVYASTTKTDLPAPIGPPALGAAAGVLPMIAISGVTARRAPEVIAWGAHGVAVAGAVCRAPDPVLAAKELVHAVTGA